MDTATKRPLITRLAIVVGAILASVGAAWGSGAFGGTPIEDAAGGALAADATVVAPATQAFAVWSVIYTAMFVYAIAQALPRATRGSRPGAVGWWVLASLVLNALWIAVIQLGWLWLSVVVIAALVGVLGWTARILARLGRAGVGDALTVDVPVGLYLGWLCVATVANVAAAGASGIDGHAPADGSWFGVGALAAVGVAWLLIARALRGAPVVVLATSATLAWGLSWIAVGRLSEAPPSQPVTVAALVVAAWAVVVALAVAATGRRGAAA